CVRSRRVRRSRSTTTVRPRTGVRYGSRPRSSRIAYTFRRGDAGMPTAVELTRGQNVHFEVMGVLQRLSTLFGKGLHVTEVDREWIRFYVDNVPDASL